jgi:hypothetical protein
MSGSSKPLGRKLFLKTTLNFLAAGASEIQPAMDATLPNEINALRELVSTLQSSLASLKEEYRQTLKQRETEIKLLRQKLEFFIKRYFGGTKNEGLDTRQLELLLAGLEVVTTLAPARVKPAPVPARPAVARPARQVLPAHLETERVVL